MTNSGARTLPLQNRERRTPLRMARTAMRLLRNFFYQEQIAYRFPTRIAPEEAIVACPAGYSIRALLGAQDYASWIELLNKDAGFGVWNDARLHDELLSSLIAPNSAGFLFKGEQMIGSAAICYTEFRGKRVPSGMYLIMDPAARGQYKLVYALFMFTIGIAAKEGHDSVFATTYPDRLPALTLYLAYGAQPCHISLWSHVQWRRIHKRLDPAVARLRARLKR